MKLFIPITKVDATQRLVYGRLAQEVEDYAGEIMDYESSKPHFEEWSQRFQKATDGKSAGNLRAMHNTVSAGKFTVVDFNDPEKAIDVVAKVVDDKEWEKVEEGIYTGFSVGGSYVKRWKDGKLTRYTGKPTEGSLVDSPCVPTATFTMIKADGSSEVRKFKERVESAKAVDELADMLNSGTIKAERLLELAKADATSAPEPETAPAAEPAPEPEPVPASEPATAAAPPEPVPAATPEPEPPANDAADEASKADSALMAKIDSGKITDREAMDEIAQRMSEDELSKLLEARPKRPEIIKALRSKIEGTLKKSLWEVQRLAEVLSCLAACASNAQYEAQIERDGSQVPEKLRAVVQQLGDALKAMTEEEVEELVESLGGYESAVLTLAAGADMKKVQGTQTAEAQKLHDALVGVGAVCPEKPTPLAGRLLKEHEAIGVGDKLREGYVAGLEKQVKELTTSIKKITDHNSTLEQRIKKIEDMPQPGKGTLRIVGKEGDAAQDGPRDEVESTPGQHNPTAAKALIIKELQKAGR